MKKQQGFYPPPYDQEIELPQHLTLYWQHFLELRRRGTQIGFGVSPITWQAIDSYLRVKSVDLEDDELDLILMADDIAVDILHKHEDKRSKINNNSNK